MVFDKVRDIIVDQLSVDESMVAMDTNLMKDLEADSLDAVEIIMAIEEEYGIEIPDEEAEKLQKKTDKIFSPAVYGGFFWLSKARLLSYVERIDHEERKDFKCSYQQITAI